MGYDAPFPNLTPDSGAAVGASSRRDPAAVAGIGRRLVAGLIDGAIFVVGILASLILVGFAFGLAQADEQTMNSDLPFWIAFGLWLAFLWFYSALLEGSSAQATLGKMALRIQVADAAGKRLSFGRASIRYWTKAVFTLLTLGISFLVAAFT